MTVQKVYIGGKSEVSIICLKCGRERKIPLSKIPNITKPSRVKCNCGHVFNVVFERRSYYRKNTHLNGTFRRLTRSERSGKITVEDISKGGLGFKTSHINDIKKDDILELEFTLDNPKKTRIKVTAVVRNIDDDQVGVEFQSLDEHTQKELGFYMM